MAIAQLGTMISPRSVRDRCCKPPFAFRKIVEPLRDLFGRSVFALSVVLGEGASVTDTTNINRYIAIVPDIGAGKAMYCIIFRDGKKAQIADLPKWFGRIYRVVKNSGNAGDYDGTTRTGTACRISIYKGGLVSVFVGTEEADGSRAAKASIMLFDEGHELVKAEMVEVDGEKVLVAVTADKKGNCTICVAGGETPFKARMGRISLPHATKTGGGAITFLKENLAITASRSGTTIKVRFGAGEGASDYCEFATNGVCRNPLVKKIMDALDA